MRIIEAGEITAAVKKLCVDANCHIGEDVIEALRNARDKDSSPLARDVLNELILNNQTAHEENVPICQDTGMAVFFIEIGDEVFVNGNIETAVSRGVSEGYTEGYLRASVVSDPLRRENTGDNTPPIIHFRFTRGDKLKITIAPKGFGSENMSALAMLKPSDGYDGVFDFVINTVRKAGPNPCPPIVVGVGIGGTMDWAARLAKLALTRDIGSKNSDGYYADMEEKLLCEINKNGVGAQGFGGDTTALAVHIETYPTHIAGLPVAVNINCHVARHKTAIL